MVVTTAVEREKDHQLKCHPVAAQKRLTIDGELRVLPTNWNRAYELHEFVSWNFFFLLPACWHSSVSSEHINVPISCVISCTALVISEKPTLAQLNFLLVISMSTGGSRPHYIHGDNLHPRPQLIKRQIHTKKIQVKFVLGIQYVDLL
jgi:hypothetical protein